MALHNWLIGAFWFGFVAFWLVMAVGAKRSIGARGLWREGGLRVAVVVLVLLGLRIPAVRQAWRTAHIFSGRDSGAIGDAGVALCALGISLAVWARIHLGRNWGMPMTRKEDPELVTSGPYAVVRHPIYTGLLLAMLGSALGESVFWTLPLGLVSAYFVYSAWREEKLMSEQFPGQYPAYRRRTKMLVPFLF